MKGRDFVAKLEQAKRRLETIMDQQEYQVYYQDNRSLIDKAIDRFLSWLVDVLNGWSINIDPSNNVGTAILYIFLLLGIIAVIVVGIFLSRNWLGKRSLKNRKPFHTHQPDWSSSQHWLEASHLEDKQLFHQATRHLFLSFLLMLHESDILLARMWKTNWEYYEEIRRNDQALAEQFYQFAIFFEEVTYGERQLNHEAYSSYRNRVQQWMEDFEKANVAEDRRV